MSTGKPFIAQQRRASRHCVPHTQARHHCH